MESDPGLFYPQLMMGIRDVNVFPLYGTRKNAGDIGAPFFPTNGIGMFVAAIGSDGGDYTNYIASSQGNGVTGVYTTGASTTLSSAVTQGAVVLTVTTSSTTAVVTSGTVTGTAVPVVNFPGTSLVAAATTITGTTLSAAATGSGQVLAGQNTITVTSATGITTGVYVQIDANVSGTTTSEVRKVTNVASTTITLDTPLYFTHANSAAVKVVAGPFTHTILQGNNLPSLTVEKNIGGYQSLQFTGTKVDKFSMKAEASDTEVTMTSNVIAKTYNVMDTPSAVSVINELPFVFSEANLTINFGYGGGAVVATQVSNVSIDIENGLKPTYTFNNSHDLQFLTPITRKITGQFDVVFTSLDDATWGFFNIMQNQVQGSLSLTFTHPTGSVPSPNPSAGYAITISLPAVNLAKYADALKLDDVVMTTLNFEAAYAIGATPPSTINSTITDGRWLPF